MSRFLVDILILLSAVLAGRQGKTLNAGKFGVCLRMELGMECGRVGVCGRKKIGGPRNG